MATLIHVLTTIFFVYQVSTTTLIWVPSLRQLGKGIVSTFLPGRFFLEKILHRIDYFLL